MEPISKRWFAFCADITSEEAAKHVGEVVTVRGTVAEVSLSKRGNAYLNFSAPFPGQTFSGDVLSKKTPELLVSGTDWLTAFQGKEATVTGKVGMCKGKPEIVITSKEDVTAAPAK